MKSGESEFSGVRPGAIVGIIRTGIVAALDRSRDAAISGLALSLAAAGLLGGAEATGREPGALVTANRTVPKVKPPRIGLQFSASPTTEELIGARVFEEPLVPIGGEPSVVENAGLAAALLAYANRGGPDDFASLTGFLEAHPDSPWRAALLAGLGFEYYNTAHYSLALEAWKKALAQPTKATNVEGRIVLARAAEELASLYARLGCMSELEALLKPFGNRGSEKINRVRESLWMMRNKPGLSFRCGPLALQSILLSNDQLFNSCSTNALVVISKATSTTNGFALTQVAALARKIGLNYQMAFREEDGEFIVPSIVHWRVGHYAAIVRQAGDRYLVEDPTFSTSVWATRQALEAETSGYFLIPPGDLPPGWRNVDVQEGASVWGKGAPPFSDGDVYTPNDLQTGGTCPAAGMPTSSVHLMMVNLQVRDTPQSYTPPLGPPVRFTFRYNSRDIYAADRTFGGCYWNGLWNTGIYDSVNDMPDTSVFVSPITRMTHDWISYLIDSPQSPLANVKWVAGGGGARTFTGFNTNSQTFAPNQYDQTLLKRTGTDSYELVWPDGSKTIFSQPDGSAGSMRRVYLTQIADPAGNALTFTYDQNLQVVAVTDAIGQVTTLTYGPGGTNLPNYLLTQVTDPFGRSATFDYEKRTNSILRGVLRVVTVDTNGTTTTTFNDITFDHEYYALTNMTDMLGLASQPVVAGVGGTIDQIVTPYGTTSFTVGGVGNDMATKNTRFAETLYPDGSRDRVEYYQFPNSGIPDSEPPATLPVGIHIVTAGFERNTYYWSRTASASSYGDYTKAKIYNWLFKDGLTVSGIPASTKKALEGRVYYEYAGQNFSTAGSSDRPIRVGRVLDDGQTQLYPQEYNGLGHLTHSVDPLGRTFSFLYSSNDVDLLEIRQTRVGNNELLFRATYDGEHRPLTTVDAAGQTNTFTYNARGQLLTVTNPKNETTSYTYDTDGYLITVDGPLPGTSDTVTTTYDFFGRVHTLTGVSGYTLIFDYDAMDRVTKITHPDSTFEQYTYDLLDLASFRDRSGRQTFFGHDAMRQLKQRTDPMGRVTRFGWCRCGQLESLTDPMGRTTTWLTDVQGRTIARQYADGSQVKYQYENTTSRPRLMIDEKQQVTQFVWNRDDTLRSVVYGHTLIPTPGVSFTYDPDYQRMVSMTDATGITRYTYNPVTATPTSGAGALASVDGPLPNDTITYTYDELGRPVHRAINGVDAAMTFDAAGRLMGVTNALGAFAYAYDAASARLVSKSFPNGQTTELTYGNTLQDLTLQRITHTFGATPISEFLYGRDVARARITAWSQQAGGQPPNLFTFGYDAADQLLSATVTNTGVLTSQFAYTYDPTGNRLTEQIGASNYTATYNALNEISTTTATGASRSNEWDAVNRLVAVTVGNQRTEFTYDGLSRRVAIRKLVNGSEVSFRRFVWCGGQICEERDAAGAVTKRFFPQGMKLLNGSNAGDYFFTRDHLGSVRELTDASGNLRARYSYHPYGRRTKVAGDTDADFGFAGMFWCGEASLLLTHFRAYDPELGRWFSRDPLRYAEIKQGPNLYAYVGNEPVSRTDPEGLETTVDAWCRHHPKECAELGTLLGGSTGEAARQALQAAPQAAPRVANAAQCFEATLPAIEPEIVALADTAPGVARNTVESIATAESFIPELSEVEILAAENAEWADLWRNAMLNMRPPFVGSYEYAFYGIKIPYITPAGFARWAEMDWILERYGQLRVLFGLPEHPW